MGDTERMSVKGHRTGDPECTCIMCQAKAPMSDRKVEPTTEFGEKFDDAMPMKQFEIKRTGDRFWINIDGICRLRARIQPGCEVIMESDRVFDKLEPD